MNKIENPENQKILTLRAAARKNLTGPQVGDFIRLPDLHPRLGKWTRITHEWDDHVQTGSGGSFFFCLGGGMSFSGSLDPGVAKKYLFETNETRDGSCWFFDQDQVGAGRGIEAVTPCRIFALHPEADLSGIDELQCPYSLTVVDPKRKPWHHGPYKFFVTMSGLAETAFTEESGLFSWLLEKGLKLSRHLPNIEGNETDHQRLAYA
jgi:hypothetical protein